MGSLISGMLEGIARVLKIIFGMDKPATTKVVEVDQSVRTGKSDDDLLAELQSEFRAENRDAGSDRKSWTANEDFRE